MRLNRPQPHHPTLASTIPEFSARVHHQELPSSGRRMCSQETKDRLLVVGYGVERLSAWSQTELLPIPHLPL